MNKGFTLIEILIVVLILGFVALAIMALIPSGYQQATVAGRMSVMNHIAQQKIDDLRATSMSDPDLVAGNHYSVFNDDFTGYSVEWNVSNDSVDPDVLTVVVTAGYMVMNADGTAITPANRFALEQSFVTKIAR